MNSGFLTGVNRGNGEEVSVTSVDSCSKAEFPDRFVIRLWLLLCLVLPMVFPAFLTKVSGAEIEMTPERAELTLLRFLAEQTRWPGEAFPTPDAPLVIGILGENPFGNMVNALAAKPVEFKNGNKSVTSRQVRVVIYKRIEEVHDCQLLFIPASVEIRSVGAIAEKFKDSAVLTVGDHERFAEVGGAVRLNPTRDRLKYDFSTAALKHTKATLGPNLFQLAKTVK
jgi:hypothetical protein